MNFLIGSGLFLLGAAGGFAWGVLFGRRGDLERQEAAARWALAGHPAEVMRPVVVEELSEEEAAERWELPASSMD